MQLLHSGAENAKAIIDWLAMLKEESVIETVTDSIITDLIEDQEYVGIFFSGKDCVPKREETEDRTRFVESHANSPHDNFCYLTFFPKNFLCFTVFHSVSQCLTVYLFLFAHS